MDTGATLDSVSMRPDFFDAVELPAGPPRLLVVVDTEEEFDWSAPFSRDAVQVSAIREVARLQAVLEPYAALPTYVIDYPVASTDSSAERLAAIADRGACHIGAHLHPWVNPPFVEAVNARNSYGCNLDPELERAKIASLREAIAAQLHVQPRVYKAGRYGFGPTTAATLEALDFDVDVSVNPHWDFTTDGGPSFERFEPVPAAFGMNRQLLEVPCTTGFIGPARTRGPALHRAASTRWLEPLRAVGVLARLGALNRVMLTPEGNSFDEMRDLTKTLFRDGLRTFSLTLHSPSLEPGHTPYVRSAADRAALLESIDRYCDFFFGPFGGVPSTPAGLFDQLRQEGSL